VAGAVEVNIISRGRIATTFLMGSSSSITKSTFVPDFLSDD